MTATLNRAKMITTTTGTGTVTLGSAVTGYATFAEAGAVNATQYPYVIEDGNDFEIGVGTYTSAGTTFSRDTVTLSKIGGVAGTSKINLSGSAQIALTARASDLYQTGGTDVAVADGGTGASTAAAAASALGLGVEDSPEFTAVNIGHASDTTLTRTAAGILAVEGAALKKAGRETIWIPAMAMIARTTNGAAVGLVEMTTNKNMFKTLDFDTTTQEFAQFEIHFPKSWDLGTVTFQPVWSHAATATNFGVVWQLQGVARSNDDAGDVAFGTAQTSTDTGGTTNDIYIAPESSAITIAGTPAVEDTVQFQIARVPANGSDTMAIDARLHGIRLFYTTNAANDT